MTTKIITKSKSCSLYSTKFRTVMHFTDSKVMEISKMMNLITWGCVWENHNIYFLIHYYVIVSYAKRILCIEWLFCISTFESNNILITIISNNKHCRLLSAQNYSLLYIFNVIYDTIYIIFISRLEIIKNHGKIK